MSETPQTATKLTEALCESFRDLKDGTVNVQVACELSNMAGKIVALVNTQLKKAKLCGEKPDIAFLR